MIHLRNDTRGSGIDTRALKRTAARLLSAVGEPGASLSLTLVRDPAIRELNRLHREKDRPTDVLSFPLEPEPFAKERLLGDIVISVDTAKRQAGEYDAPLQNELYRLLIHGLLHLLGHDHMEPDERAVMETEERRLAAGIALPWPYDAQD